MNSRVIVVGVIKKDNRVLVGQKAPNVGPYPNTWHIPGGGVELDHEPNKHGEMTHYLFLSFTADYKSGEIEANDDMQKLKWVSKEELKQLNMNKPSVKLLKKLQLI